MFSEMSYMDEGAVKFILRMRDSSLIRVTKLLLSTLFFVATVAMADDYPSKPVTIVVGFGGRGQC